MTIHVHQGASPTVVGILAKALNAASKSPTMAMLRAKAALKRVGGTIRYNPEDRVGDFYSPPKKVLLIPPPGKKWYGYDLRAEICSVEGETRSEFWTRVCRYVEDAGLEKVM